MLNIEEIEETILIETNDFNYCIGNLVNDISFQDEKLSEEETYKAASKIIRSMIERDLIKMVKTECRKVEEDLYEPVSSNDLTVLELEEFLANPDKWDEMDIFSEELTFELSITETGRKFFQEKLN